MDSIGKSIGKNENKIRGLQVFFQHEKVPIFLQPTNLSLRGSRFSELTHLHGFTGQVEPPATSIEPTVARTSQTAFSPTRLCKRNRSPSCALKFNSQGFAAEQKGWKGAAPPVPSSRSGGSSLKISLIPPHPNRSYWGWGGEFIVRMSRWVWGRAGERARGLPVNPELVPPHGSALT